MWTIVVAALLLTGIHALRGRGSALLYGDEVHTLGRLHRSYGELFRTFDANGSGIALPLLQKERHREAAEAFELALEQNPYSADAHHNLGLLLERIGRGSEAADHLRLAAELDPRLARSGP